MHVVARYNNREFYFSTVEDIPPPARPAFFLTNLGTDPDTKTRWR
jgi:hypothetical protein